MRCLLRFSTGLPARIGLAVMTLTAAIVLGGSPGAARDAFVAGGRSTTTVTLGEADRRAAADRALQASRALGLADGARLEIVRLDDRFAGEVVDEVTFLDGKGRPQAILRTTPTGRLRTAVRLGWSDAVGSLSAATATNRARSLLGSIGLVAQGRPVAATDRSGRGWTVAWPRRADGVPVRGDGTWVRLWPDGSVHSIAVAEAELAPAPARTLPSSEASRLAEAVVAGWADGGPARGTVGEMALAWIAPNDLFEPSRPDAPDPVRRLAWVARVTPVGDLASRLRSIELFIDAGDGRLLGGDVLE